MSKQQEALRIALEALKQIDEAMPFPVAKLAQAAIKEALAQPEFIKHEVKNADDWSEWVCPDPKGYLMKCCDCGLVHEAEFAVVRYKSETEREDCDMVDDPNLQAVFRMRRSEEWTPEDTAHRVGGLPMAQPEQPRVRTGNCLRVGVCASEGHKIAPQRTWVGLTHEERKDTLQSVNTGFVVDASVVALAIEAKLKEKNNG